MNSEEFEVEDLTGLACCLGVGVIAAVITPYTKTSITIDQVEIEEKDLEKVGIKGGKAKIRVKKKTSNSLMRVAAGVTGFVTALISPEAGIVYLSGLMLVRYIKG